MKLYCQSGSDYSIVDETGNRYTPGEAKILWQREDVMVEDWNLPFQRLIEFDFDLERLKTYFKERGGYG